MEFLKKPQFWIGIIFTVGSLVALYFFIDLQETIEAIRKANFLYVLAALPFLVGHMAVRAVRWRYLLDEDISFWRTFHIQNIGYMLNQILPLHLGDVARGVLVGQENDIEVPEALTTVVVERLLDVIAVIMLLPLSLITVRSLPGWMNQAIYVAGGIALAALVVLVLAANNRERVADWMRSIIEKLPKLDADHWTDYIDEILQGLQKLRSWRSGGYVLGLSLAMWLPMAGAYWLVMLAVGIETGLLLPLFGVVAGSLSFAIPSSPGQIGVYHGGVTAALTRADVGRSLASSFAFLMHALYFLTMIALGIVAMTQTESSFRKTIEAAQQFGKGNGGDKEPAGAVAAD